MDSVAFPVTLTLMSVLRIPAAQGRHASIQSIRSFVTVRRVIVVRYVRQISMNALVFPAQTVEHVTISLITLSVRASRVSAEWIVEPMSMNAAHFHAEITGNVSMRA